MTSRISSGSSGPTVQPTCTPAQVDIQEKVTPFVETTIPAVTGLQLEVGVATGCLGGCLLEIVPIIREAGASCLAFIDRISSNTSRD